MTARVHRNTVLTPVTDAVDTLFYIQHDNVRQHTARLTTQFLTANNVDVMHSPALSADMSPIENI